jgi:hypothetical protein
MTDRAAILDRLDEQVAASDGSGAFAYSAYQGHGSGSAPGTPGHREPQRLAAATPSSDTNVCADAVVLNR